MANTPYRFATARVVATLLFAFITYAIVVPNCIVPELAGRPARFEWLGLLPPSVIVALVTWAIWYKR
jgi:hypothetical protein